MTARRRWLAALCLLALALGLALAAALPAAAQAQGGAIPIADYWQRIAAARDDVRAAQSLDGAERRAKLDSAAGALDGVQAVTLPDGSVVPVNNGALVDELRGANPDLPAILRELAALRQAGSEPGAPAPREGAEQRLAEIMARPEFQYQSQSPSDDLVGRIARQILETILRILAIPAVAYCMVAAGALLLGGVLVWVVYGMAGESLSGGVIAPAGEALPDENLSAAQALQRANNLAAGGDYRSAVRYLYLSTLLFLEEAGRLRYDRSLTNREYLSQVEGQPDVLEPLRDVVATFDRVWYGFAPVDARAYEAFLAEVQTLRRVRVAA